MVSSVTSSSHSVPSMVQMWTFRTLLAKIFSSCTNIVAAAAVAAAAAGPQGSPLKTLREPAVYSPESRPLLRLNLPWQQTRPHGLIRTFSGRTICPARPLRRIDIFSLGQRGLLTRSCNREARSVDTCDARTTAVGRAQQCACVPSRTVIGGGRQTRRRVVLQTLKTASDGSGSP